MFCYGLTSYMPMLGGFNNPFGFFNPMMPAMPKYSVNDYNIFGFTPPVNFGYMPWLDNGVKPYNVYPQPLLFGMGNYTQPQQNYVGGGLFNFLSANNTGSDGYNDIFDFLGKKSGSVCSNQSSTITQNIATTQKPKKSTNQNTNITNPYRYGGYSTTTFGFLTAKPVVTRQTNSTTSSNSSSAHASSNSTINKAVELAASQLGVTENGNSNDSTAIRQYKNGAVDNNAWCGSFVSWCYGSAQGGNNAKTFGYDTSSQSIRQKAEKAGCYSKKSSGYTPQVGDLMILKYSNKDGGHVGIITAVNQDGSFETIEGNYQNGVKRVHRSKNTACLHGFVRMNDWLQA